MSMSIDTDAVIDRIARGEYQSHIARELGCAPSLLHAKIGNLPAYRAAMELRNQAKLDKGQAGIESAESAMELARAREEFKAAAWRAQAECPAVWGGAKSQVHITADGPVSVQLVSFSHDAAQQTDETPYVTIESSSQLVDNKEEQ